MCEDTVDFTVGPSMTNHLVLSSSVFEAAIGSSKGFIQPMHLHKH